MYTIRIDFKLYERSPQHRNVCMSKLIIQIITETKFVEPQSPHVCVIVIRKVTCRFKRHNKLDHAKSFNKLSRLLEFLMKHCYP